MGRREQPVAGWPIPAEAADDRGSARGRDGITLRIPDAGTGASRSCPDRVTVFATRSGRGGIARPERSRRRTGASYREVAVLASVPPARSLLGALVPEPFDFRPVLAQQRPVERLRECAQRLHPRPVFREFRRPLQVPLRLGQQGLGPRRSPLSPLWFQRYHRRHQHSHGVVQRPPHALNHVFGYRRRPPRGSTVRARIVIRLPMARCGAFLRCPNLTVGSRCRYRTLRFPADGYTRTPKGSPPSFRSRWIGSADARTGPPRGSRSPAARSTATPPGSRPPPSPLHARHGAAGLVGEPRERGAPSAHREALSCLSLESGGLRESQDGIRNPMFSAGFRRKAFRHDTLSVPA